jgi:hypothetical protein
LHWESKLFQNAFRLLDHIQHNSRICQFFFKIEYSPDIEPLSIRTCGLYIPGFGVDSFQAFQTIYISHAMTRLHSLVERNLTKFEL